MSLDDVKTDIRMRWGSTPAVSISASIIDWLEAMPGDQLTMLTLRSLLTAARRSALDADVLSAINILSSSRRPMLDARALFIDEDNSEYQIDLGDLEEARRTGVFIHPGTGEVVPEFEGMTMPYFIPSKFFFESKNER